MILNLKSIKATLIYMKFLVWLFSLILLILEELNFKEYTSLLQDIFAFNDNNDKSTILSQTNFGQKMKCFFAVCFLFLNVMAFSQNTLNCNALNTCTNAVSFSGVGVYQDNAGNYHYVPFSGIAAPSPYLNDPNPTMTPFHVGTSDSNFNHWNGIETYDPTGTYFIDYEYNLSQLDCSYPAPTNAPPNNNNDQPPGCDGSSGCNCGGMPVWSVSEPYISLWLHDEPLGYQPATGPRISFKLDFKQRETNAGYNTNWSSIGKRWNYSWSSYITQDVNSNNIVNFPNGGQRTYYSNSVDLLTQTILSGGTSSGFSLLYPDGSQYIYGLIVTNATGVFQEAFITKSINAQGQKTLFNYSSYVPSAPVIRLQSVIDGDGRTNLIYYATNNPYNTNLIAKVVDAFGRAAYLSYNNNGDLTNITDVAGNSTSLGYDTNDWVSNMTTPYGTTAFAITDSGTNTTASGRSVLVTRPDQSQELYLYEDNAPGIAGAYNTNLVVPQTLSTGNFFDNSDLNIRNTFHWGARQYAALSTANIASFTANDFLKAHMKHWLIENATNTTSGTLSLERDPSPDSGGAIEGEKIWYDYSGKTFSEAQGTSFLPSTIARILPDGTTSFNYTVRNSQGLVTTNISTYSVNGIVSLRTNIFTYATNGIDLISETNALGVQVISNYYNANHEVLTNYDALNQKTTYLYNGSNQLVRTIAPNGLTTTNVYGANNLLTQTIVTGYQTNSYTYTNDLIWTATDARGLKTTNVWDNLNRLVSTIYPDGTTTSNQYTALDVTAAKDRLGNWTYMGYDSLRRMIAQTNALGQVTIYNYCTCGSLESVLDAGGNLTQYQYDNQANLTNTIYADGYFMATTYDLLRRVVQTTDSSGNTTTNLYNNQGLLVSAANSIGLLTTNNYDILDRVTNSVDANNVSINTTYDNLNRPLTRSYPDGGVEKYVYTTNIPSATSYTNQIGNAVVYSYDLLNRKTNEVFVGVMTNKYVYSGPGDLLQIIDGNAQTTTFAYDAYGRVTNKLDALGTNIFRYQYDANNRLTNRWTPAKGTTVYRYDALGNLTNVDYSGGSTPMTNVFLAYDSLNRLTNMVDAVGTTVYSYDAVGELLSEGGLWANDTVNYSYANRLRTGLSLAQPNTSPWTQSYGYDNAHRLTSLTSQAGTFNYVYDPVRQMQVGVLSLPNGAYITNSYDVVARLAGTTLAANTGTALDSYNYAYNQASQRTNVVRTAGDSVAYTYDNMGELKTANGKEAGGVTNRWQEQYGYVYDAAGNLTSRTNNKLLQTFKLNALNEMTNNIRSGTFTVAGTTTTAATNVTVNTTNAIRYADYTFAATNFTLVSGANTFTAIAKDALGNLSTNVSVATLLATNNYSYDLNGNLRTNGNQVLDYDDENQLIRVTVTNAWKDEFAYDGKFRRRIERDYTWSGSAWTETNEVHFLYDGNVVLEERNSNNVPLVTYTRGNDLGGTLQGAGGIGGLLARSDHSQPPTPYYSAHSYYHADGNGNITMLINADQVVVAKYLYDPYGNTLSMSGSLATQNNYRFSSKEWNNNSGYYYYLYRYYDPNLQRWINRDPIQERGGLNLYDFTGNSSVYNFDSLGEDIAGYGGGTGDQNNPPYLPPPPTAGFHVVGTTIDDWFGKILQIIGIDHVDIAYNGTVIYVGEGGGAGRQGAQYPRMNHDYRLSKASSGMLKYGSKTPCKCASDADIINCLQKRYPSPGKNCQGDVQDATGDCCLTGFSTIVSKFFPTF